MRSVPGHILQLLRAQFAPAVALFARLSWATLFTRTTGVCRPTFKRTLVMLAFLPALGIVQCLHWLGFLLDELLFPRYRDIDIREPLFITGAPRSGTTLLHRTLAEDPQFTTLRTWELFFALSITARKILLALAKLDRMVGGPLKRALDRLQGCAFQSFDGIHGVTLDAPEEDYFALTPIGACFLLVIPFPFCEALWRLSRFDASLSAREKRRVLSFYTLCLQKHLYVHGEGKRLLSKNSSFSSWTGALREAFPDCRIVCCVRDPTAAVPSLLNAIESGVKMFDIDRQSGVMYGRMIGMMQHYYERLLTELPDAPADRHAFVTLDDLHRDLQATVTRTYERLMLPVSPNFKSRLASAALNARDYRSPCRHSPERFRLRTGELREQFRIYYRWRGQQVGQRRATHSTGVRETVHE